MHTSIARKIHPLTRRAITREFPQVEASHPAGKILFMAAIVSIFLTALFLPWVGTDFVILSKTIHIHSLKNISGAFLLILALSSISRPFQKRFQTLRVSLEEQASKHPRGFPWTIAILSGLLFTNTKLVQHMSLQTHAFDLGVYANTCWNTLHGHFLYDSVLGINCLGDHFHPVLAFLSPAFLLWNSAGILLVIQSLGLALGIPPLFWMVKKATGHGSLGIGLCLVYLTGPYLNSVSAFDFHSIALAIPAFLWGLWFLEAGRPCAFLGTCLFALTLKEDVPIVLAALGAVLALTNRPMRRWGIFFAIFGIAALCIEVLIVMPHFLHGQESYRMDRYSYLGGSPMTIISGLIFPLPKWRSLLKYIGSVGFLSIFDWPAFLPGLVALLPHLLSNYPNEYSLSAHYTALSLPFTFFAASRGMTKLFSRFRPGGSLNSFVQISRLDGVGCLLAGCLVLSGGALLSNSRYVRTPDWPRVQEFFKLVERLPPEASVRAQSDLLPHVCLRSKVHLFAPFERYKKLPLFESSKAETDYILLDKEGNFWPMDAEEFQRERERLEKEGHYRLLKSVRGFEVWQRCG